MKEVVYDGSLRFRVDHIPNLDGPWLLIRRLGTGDMVTINIDQTRRLVAFVAEHMPEAMDARVKKDSNVE